MSTVHAVAEWQVTEIGKVLVYAGVLCYCVYCSGVSDNVKQGTQMTVSNDDCDRGRFAYFYASANVFVRGMNLGCLCICVSVRPCIPNVVNIIS